jgi:hypothetical protein
MKIDKSNAYYGNGGQMQVFPLFKGDREKYEVIEDMDFRIDLMGLYNRDLVSMYFQAYNMYTRGQFNRSDYDVKRIRELLFGIPNKCTKCKVSKSIDWLKCDNDDKVGLCFIVRNFIYIYILSSARDVSLNL